MYIIPTVMYMHWQYLNKGSVDRYFWSFHNTYNYGFQGQWKASKCDKKVFLYILVHLYTHTRDSFLQEMSRQNVSKKQFLLVLMVSTCWSSGSESQSQEQFRVICKPITIKSSLRLSTSHQAGTYWINQVIIIHILGVHDRA